MKTLLSTKPGQMNIKLRLITLLAVVLLSAASNAQTKTQNEKHYYYPVIPKAEFNEAKNSLAKLLRETESWDDRNRPSSFPKDVSVSDDGFNITYKRNKASTWLFSKLLKTPIEIIRVDDVPPSWSGYTIRLGGLRFTTEANTGNFKQLANYLCFFQQYYHLYSEQPFNSIQQNDSLLSLFKSIAAKYRELKIKPAVSEEQRRFIVQANSLNEKKMFDKAIELYKKAVEIDPTAYPAAYSNLALLSAQVSNFDAAIFYMKKYLLLEPDGSDARSAQDKIYEWELNVAK